jgi:phosphinothricin acetyltransferase
MIRDATADDSAAIAAIWNEVIRDTVFTFNSVEKSPVDVANLIVEKARLGQGFFVAMAADTVVGFATYGQFRNGIGYQHTAEHSIVLAPLAHGQGFGRRLMDTLQDHARAAGIHTLWAGVSAENPDGEAFHARIGFTRIARLPQVGRKFDRWIDLILMQKHL